jgi:hypothetical protein
MSWRSEFLSTILAVWAGHLSCFPRILAVFGSIFQLDFLSTPCYIPFILPLPGKSTLPNLWQEIRVGSTCGKTAAHFPTELEKVYEVFDTFQVDSCR